jgi:uncharacterized protein
MSIRTSRWPEGVPCWADLTVPDVEAAQRFYTAVLGWSYSATDIEFGGYTIASVHGAAAAGIGPLPRGAPVTWTLYLAADDVDKAAAAVPLHGGRMLMRPHDVGTLGRTFIATDPTGAEFGVWQAGTLIGNGVVNEPGGLTWEDLRSPDPETARSFYRGVFGHHTEPLPEAGPDYHVFSLPGDEFPLGGMGGMEDEAPDGNSPRDRSAGRGRNTKRAYWLVYFAVADVEATALAAERAGGRVLQRDFDSPYGRMAELADPDGARFSVLETSGEDGPDRSG